MATEPTHLPTPARYHGAAIVLHWLLAALLVYQFALGLRLEDVAGPLKFTAYQFHKSIGITILLLSLARLALRLAVPRPGEVGEGLQRLAGRLTHWAFYAVMLLVPLSGWIIVSTAKLKVPTMLFGAVPWPHLPLPAGFNEPAGVAHTVLAWTLPALIALHVAAVIYHLRQRDAVPGRMFPAALAPLLGLLGGLALLAATAGLGLAGPLPDLWHRALTAPMVSPPESDDASDASDAAAAETPSPVPSPTAETAATLSCNWTVEPGSRLSFTAHYGGEPVNGTFHKWQAKVRFCEDDLAKAAISATVNLGSADTQDATRDESLKGPSFFNSASFAQAKFTANGFKQLAPGRYSAGGTLSLHGVSRPVRLVFTLKVSGDTAQAQGSTTLSRLAFGVGSDEWTATDQIPDPVSVQFTIRAHRAE